MDIPLISVFLIVGSYAVAVLAIVRLISERRTDVLKRIQDMKRIETEMSSLRSLPMETTKELEIMSTALAHLEESRGLAAEVTKIAEALSILEERFSRLVTAVAVIEDNLIPRHEVASLTTAVNRLELTQVRPEEVTDLANAVSGMKETRVFPEEMAKVVDNLSHIETSLRHVLKQMDGMVTAEELNKALSDAARAAAKREAALHETIARVSKEELDKIVWPASAADLTEVEKRLEGSIMTNRVTTMGVLDRLTKVEKVMSPDMEYYQAWFAAAQSDGVEAEVRIHSTGRRTELENKAWLESDDLCDTSVENRDSWMGLTDETWQLRGGEYTKVYYKPGEWSGGVKINIHLKFKDGSKTKTGSVCCNIFQQMYPLLEWERVLLSVKQAVTETAPTTA